MATRYSAISVDPEPDQNVTAESFDEPQALARFRSAERRVDRALRNRLENLLNKREALLDLANAEPDARVDITGVEHRHFERQFVIGHIRKRAPRIEAPAGRTADIAAGAELRRQFRFHNPRGHCPILQRSRIVVEVDQLL